ncbi:MAG: hypothetical protein IJO99_00910 [Ruminococcus sp.]|nr:hypothetical protein [Ruminococcus sp.]
MINNQLEKINRLTRRPLTADEVYIFSVVLCDNETDRDCECFSDEALSQLQKLFIGKTGISDHDPRASNQNARIFDTELVTDDSRTTKNGKPYKYLKASVYMVRTDENRSLIAEIDGGIKKEVSISCSASRKICSVCGCDKTKTGCAHVKGKTYNGKLCHTILDNITDAYEWSFVAVPAQISAGVTKKLSFDENVQSASPSSDAVADIKACNDELRRDICRLAFFAGGKTASDTAVISAENLTTKQLIAMKKSFEEKLNGVSCEIQLYSGVNSSDNGSHDAFSMK